MADAVRVESLDAIPEALRSQFVEVEVEGATLYEQKLPVNNNPKLESAYAKLKRDAERREAEMKAMLDRYAVDGEMLDPEQIKALLDERKQREGKELIPRTEAEKEKAELREKVQAALKKDIDAREAKIAELEAMLHSELIDGGISRTAQSQDVPFRLRKGGVAALVKIAKADKVFRIIDGKPVPFEGDRPMEKADGSQATMVDWMAKAAADYGLLEDSQGTGASPSLTGGGSAKRRLEDCKTIEEKIEYWKQDAARNGRPAAPI